MTADESASIAKSSGTCSGLYRSSLAIVLFFFRLNELRKVRDQEAERDMPDGCRIGLVFFLVRRVDFCSSLTSSISMDQFDWSSCSGPGEGERDRGGSDSSSLSSVLSSRSTSSASFASSESWGGLAFKPLLGNCSAAIVLFFFRLNELRKVCAQELERFGLVPSCEVDFFLLLVGRVPGRGSEVNSSISIDQAD